MGKIDADQIITKKMNNSITYDLFYERKVCSSMRPRLNCERENERTLLKIGDIASEKSS